MHSVSEMAPLSKTQFGKSMKVNSASIQVHDLHTYTNTCTLNTMLRLLYCVVAQALCGSTREFKRPRIYPKICRFCNGCM